MSWRDEYEQGSFRGAGFRTEGHERQGGRRVVMHELPSRDEPVVEDLGRRPRQFSIDCHVVGDDYRSRRDALIDALEAEGPGLLVHPWHGRVMVVALDYSSSETTDEGGICRFHISFGEAGLAPASPVALPAGLQAADAASRAIGAAPGIFAGRFSIAGVASFVEDAAGSLISGMADVSQIAAGLRGGVGPALRAFDAGLRFLPANLAGLLRAPLDLAHSVVGLVQAVSLLGGGGGRSTRLAALEMMVDWQPSDPVFPPATAQRRQEAANRTALLCLFRTVAAAELVRTASAADYDSQLDAVLVRDAVAGRLEVLATEAADRGDDPVAQTFDDLRRALARDIAAKAPTLARVYGLELAATEPALVLSHRLYGGSRLSGDDPEAQALAIAARNRLAHPGFIPAGVRLELLTPGSAAA